MVLGGCTTVRRESSLGVLVRSRDSTYVELLEQCWRKISKHSICLLPCVCLFSQPSIVYIAISNFSITSNKAAVDIHSHPE